MNAIHETELTLGDVIDKYIAVVLPLKKKKGATHTQEFQLLWWKERLGDKPIADIGTKEISALREELLQKTSEQRGTPLSPATVNRFLSALSHVFTVAQNDWEVCDDNPCKRVRKYKESRGRTRYLDDTERARLLAECKKSEQEELYPLVVLALSTGMRRGELMALNWRSVDMERRAVHILDSKNGSARTVPLTEAAYDCLLSIWEGSGPVFHSKMRSAWEQALVRAGLDDFRFHDLRHTCASYMSQAGVDARTIAEVLGHKTLQMAMKYAHLNIQAQRTALDKMDTIMWPAAHE